VLRRQAAVERVDQALRVRIAVRVAVDIVHIDQIDTREPESLQAVFERAAHALRAVVVALHEGQRVDVAVLVARRIGARFEQPADLGRQQIIIAWPGAQRVADASFRAAVSVMRRGIEIAHAGVVGVGDERFRGLIRNGAKQIAQRRTAKTERRCAQTGKQRRVQRHIRRCDMRLSSRAYSTGAGSPGPCIGDIVSAVDADGTANNARGA
jgi:hypothetical protein